MVNQDTPVLGESDAHRIFDSIGQGSFGAALASSLNIGCAIYNATMGEFITDLARCNAIKLFNISGRHCEVEHNPGASKNWRRTNHRNTGKEEIKVKLWQVKVCLTRIPGVQRKNPKRGQGPKANPIMMGSHEMEESP